MENNVEYKEWLDNIKKEGYPLRFVPYELRTKELCEIAVEEEEEALQFVPEEFRKELADDFGIDLPEKAQSR